MQNSTLLPSRAITQVSQFTSTNVYFNGQGVIGTALAGTTSNIDLTIADDCFFTGGVLRTKNATFGDHLSLQIVDVTGIYAPANTVLGQYATDWYMGSDVQEQVNIEVPYPGSIYAGLVMRCVYTSIGTTDVAVTLNYTMHKALY